MPSVPMLQLVDTDLAARQQSKVTSVGIAFLTFAKKRFLLVVFTFSEITI
jgi:hypothetical protein